jgi:hypothetical protein
MNNWLTFLSTHKSILRPNGSNQPNSLSDKEIIHHLADERRCVEVSGAVETVEA